MRFSYRLLQSEHLLSDYQLMNLVCGLCGFRNPYGEVACQECGQKLLVKEVPRKQVYAGEIEAADEVQALDVLFDRFNNDHPRGYCGRSMSSGDVVVLNTNRWLCCGEGWNKLNRLGTEIGKIDEFEGEFGFLGTDSALPSPIEYEGIEYPTLRHAFEAAKTLLVPIRKAIAALPTQSAAKHVGNKLSVRGDWPSEKARIMEDLVMRKFTANPGLGRDLLATGDAYLEAGNDGSEIDDLFWGVCKGIGENHLGQILMRTRDVLRADAARKEGAA